MPPPYKVKAAGNPFSQPGPAKVTFGTLTAEVANSRVQSLTVTDENGLALAKPTLVTVWLTTNSDGTDVVASAASSDLAAGTNGKKMATLVTGKIGLFQTDSQGRLDVNITDTAVRTVYLAVQTADEGLAVTAGIAFA